MTAKERRNIKHSLKTKLDSADMYIKLADIGGGLGVSTPENRDETLNGRELLIKKLNEIKSDISNGCSKFIAEIDNAISKLS